MKKTQLLSLATLATLAFSSAYANGKAECDRAIKEYNDVHCTYLAGMDKEASQFKGKYIKHYDPEKDITKISCVSANNPEEDIYQETAEYYVGNHSIQYSICTDASGNICEFVGTDAYTVEAEGDKYIGSPPTYGIDLTAVKNKYPSCTAYVNNPQKLQFQLQAPIKR